MKSVDEQFSVVQVISQSTNSFSFRKPTSRAGIQTKWEPTQKKYYSTAPMVVEDATAALQRKSCVVFNLTYRGSILVHFNGLHKVCGHVTCFYGPVFMQVCVDKQ